MKKILSIAIVSAIALGAAACNARYEGGETAPSPTVKMSEDGHHLITAYEQEGTPVLDRWSNGKITVNCPIGYHFEILELRRADGRSVEQKAECEPNELTDEQDRPDPTRSADGRDG